MKTFGKIWTAGLIVLCSTVQAGTITGIVQAQGKPGADQDAATGKYESRKFKFAERVNYAQLRDFVVYIEGGVFPKPLPPLKPLQIVSQKDATFKPHILPVVIGTVVEWPNQDEIFHNAFSMSEAQPFDLGLYKDEIKRVKFDKPGRLDVFCSIHTAMHCIVLVLENPHFATTDAKGRYAMTNVPAGTYKLKAWHERLPSLTKEITVPETGEVKVDFTLGIINLPKY